MTRRQRLDQLIDRFLSGKSTLIEFQQAYQARYAYNNADVEFSLEEVDHYAAVHERAEWTRAQPTVEDRRFGWWDEDEFLTWLRVHELVKPL